MTGELYIVGTPIGNLGDFSFRAVETLKKVDFIAAEDTRVSIKLLNSFGIKKRLVSYREHNSAEKGPLIIQRLLNGESCALVTDAGMPAISDPGKNLVRLCHEKGIKVCSVPGPSAVTTALALSGFEASRFSFEGFLTLNKPKRRLRLEEIKNEKKTMVFYEAPHKLAATLHDLYASLGDRKIAIVKELTKIYENVRLGSLSEFDGKFDGVKLKGEYVIIIEAKNEKNTRSGTENPEPVEKARLYVKEGMSVNEAAKRTAKETGAKKSEIYKKLNEKNNKRQI